MSRVGSRRIPAVIELARSTTTGFTKDPRAGTWAAALRADDAFASVYATTSLDSYEAIVPGSARLLFDRDTVPGPEREDLQLLDIPALVVPGGGVDGTCT